MKRRYLYLVGRIGLFFTIAILLAACTSTVVKPPPLPPPPPPPLVTEITFPDLLGKVAKTNRLAFVEQYDAAVCEAVCQAQHALVDKLAESYKGKVNFYRVKVDSGEFNSGTDWPIYFIVYPPFILFDTYTGVKTEVELRQAIDEIYNLLTAPIGTSKRTVK